MLFWRSMQPQPPSLNCLSLAFSLPPSLSLSLLIHLSLSLRIPSVYTLNAHRSRGRSIRAAMTTYLSSFDKIRLIHSIKFACRKRQHTVLPRHVALFPLNESSIVNATSTTAEFYLIFQQKVV